MLTQTGSRQKRVAVLSGLVAESAKAKIHEMHPFRNPAHKQDKEYNQ
jgi:hypothetical protein